MSSLIALESLPSLELSTEQKMQLTRECHRKFNALRKAMKLVPAGRGRRSAFRALAEHLQNLGVSISSESLKRFYYGVQSGDFKRPGYVTHGELALVDHRLCGGKCGLPGCNTARADVLNTDVVDAWIKLAEDNDKRSLRKAYRDLLAQLASGKVIAGVGTWRTLYTMLNPGRALPPQCPYSAQRPPAGWSLSSFMARLPEDYEYTLGKKGLAAAENQLAQAAPVRTSLADLRFMEVVVFDDHRLDFKAFIGNQIVELWGVFAMDLATRTILAWGVRPRLKTDDGVKQSLTRRDVQHLCASMIQTHGLPKDYASTWLVENAAAAITTDFENALERLMPGRIFIDRTSVGDGRSRGWLEKYGKPRGKRWLESWFNLFEIELGSTLGQMGNRWENKPGDFDHRQNIGTKMAGLGIIAQLPQSVKPFDDIAAAMHAVHDAILRTENREGHDLVDFRTLRFWRISAADTWKSVEETFFLALPIDQQNALLSQRETGLVRPETPAERREFLRDPAKFEIVDPSTCFELYLDQVSITYQGADCLTFDFAGRTFDFAGTRHRATVGQKITVKFDADRPDVCVLMDLPGRVLGSMHVRRRPGYFEKEATATRLGERQKALGKALRNVRVRHADPQAAQDYLEAIEIVNAALPAPKETSRRIATPVLEAYAEASTSPRTTNADAILARAQKRRKSQPEPMPEPVATIEHEPITDPGW